MKRIKKYLEKNRAITALILGLCLYANALQAQFKIKDYFAKTFVVGASFTRMADVNADKNAGLHYYNENTFNVNIMMSLSKRFWIGLQVKPIFTKQYVNGTITKSFYNFNGLFTQFEIVNKNGFRIYTETSLNLSDYCSCAGENPWDDPVRKKGLILWGGGGGLEFTLNPKKSKNLSLELAFFNYVILQKIPYKYNYTQYILGLNYKFGKIE